MNKQMCGEIAENDLRVIQKLYNETKMNVALVQDEGKLVALFYSDKFSLFLDIVDGVVTDIMLLVNKIYQITMDDMGNGLDVSFLAKAENITQLEAVRKKIKGLSEQTTISIIDQPNLVI